MLMGMNCDDEKMAIISSTSTTNEWPQHNNYNNNNNNGIHMISDDHQQKALTTTTSLNMASSTTAAPRTTSGAPMEKPGQDQQQQQALKCPRCDSSNTKFCYYNNYSLSQPRHFCKACKRYWTRGGTLRNVPVGGGCRKNKRIKRPSSSAAAGTSSAVDVSSSPNSSSSNLGAVINSHPSMSNSQPGASNHHHHHQMASLFYNNHDHMSLPFSRFSSGASGYDHMTLQPQLSALGLGFSSSANGGDTASTHDTNYLNGLITSNSLLSSYSSIFGTTASTSTASASPTIASLLSSKLAGGGLKDHMSGVRGLSSFQALTPFDELHMSGGISGHEAAMTGSNKHVKLEDGQGQIRAFDWITGGAEPNQTVQIGLSSDPSLYWTNPTAVGGGAASWHDPPAIGSNSVPSLI